MLDRLTTLPATFIEPDGQRLSRSAYAFLVLMCLAFFIPGIATLPPTDRDESSFAQASKQMVETGNYTDIRLQDKPRYKKPVGIYWLQAATVKLLNRDHLNEIWAYRLPSVMGATIAVVMTAALGTLLFGPMAGLLAAIMMAGCVVLNVEARLAKTDAVLLGSIMAMQYALARAYLSRTSLLINLTFWTAFAIGVLIKGPVILLILASTLLWLRMTDRNLKWFSSLKPLLGIPYALLLIAPWFIAIYMQSKGTFLQQSAGQDLFAKLWQGQDRGALIPGLHLVAFPLVFFPFSLFTLLAIPDILKNHHEPALRFCLGWIVPVWIVFELSMTKLPHYVMVVYPAIAMLTAKALLDGYPALAERNWRWLIALAVALWLMIGTGVATSLVLLPYLSDKIWNIGQMTVGLLLIIAQGTSLFLLMQRKPNSIIVIALGTFIFITATFGGTLPSLQHLWVSRQAFQMANVIKPCEKLQMISSAYREPSLVFLAGTHTILTNDGVQAAYELQNNPCRVALIDADHEKPFLSGITDRTNLPLAVAKIQGLNIGHGAPTILTLYILPQKAAVQ